MDKSSPGATDVEHPSRAEAPEPALSPGPPGSSLAERIDRLFATVRDPHRGAEYSYDQVAEAVAAEGGTTISANYVYMLRRGIRDNPTKKHLEALARFFGVNPSFFFDDNPVDTEALRVGAALRDRHLLDVVEAASGLPPETLAAVKNLLRNTSRTVRSGPSTTTRKPSTRPSIPDTASTNPEPATPSELDPEKERVDLELNYIKLALVNGEAGEALHRLDCLSQTDGLDEYTRDSITFLTTHALNHLNQLDEATRLCFPLFNRCLDGESQYPLEWVGLAMCRYLSDSGETIAAIEVGQAALKTVEDHGLTGTDDHIRLGATLMGAHYDRGDYFQATTLGQQLIDISRESGSAAGQSAAYWNSALLAEARGEPVVAVRLARQALAAMGEQETNRDTPRLRADAAWTMLRADPALAAEATQVVEGARQAIEDLGSRADIAWWAFVRALAHLLLGELDAAEDLGRQSLGDICGPENRARCQVLLGDVERAREHPTEAMRYYRAAVAEFDDRPITRLHARVLREVADRLAGTDPDTAFTAYRRALDVAGMPADTLADGPIGTGRTSPAHPTGPSAAPDLGQPREQVPISTPETDDATSNTGGRGAHPESRPVTPELELVKARRALREGAPEQAVDRLRRLLDVPGLDPRSTDQALLALGEAQRGLGRLDDAVATLLPLYERSREGRTQLTTDTVSLVLAGCLHEAGDLREALRVAEAGLAAAKTRLLEGGSDHLRLTATAMGIHLDLGDRIRAAGLADLLLTLVAEHGSPADQATVYWNASAVASSRGRTAEAQDLARHALAALDTPGTGREAARLSCRAVWVVLRTVADHVPERLAEAVAVLDRIQPELAGSRTPVDHGAWCATRALAHLLDGQLAGAERLAEQACSLLGTSGDRPPTSTTHPGGDPAVARVLLGDVLTAQGRDEEAREQYRAALDATSSWPATGSPGGSLTAASVLREIAERLDRLADPAAARAYRRALDTAGIADQLSPSQVSLLETGGHQPAPAGVHRPVELQGHEPTQLETLDSHRRYDLVQSELSFARLALTHGDAMAAQDRLTALLDSANLDKETRDHALYLLALAHERANDLDAAVRVLLPVHTRILTGESHLPLPAVSIALCRVLMDSSDLRAAARVGEESLRVAAKHGSTVTSEYLRLAATVGGIYYELGDLTQATAHLDTFIAIAAQEGLPAGQSALYWNAALVAESRDRQDEAAHLGERALALVSEGDTTRDLGRLRSEVAWLVLRADPSRAPEATAILDRALPALQDFGSPADMATWERVRSLSELLTGEPERAERTARQALDLLSPYPTSETAQVLVTLGDALAAQKRDDDARAQYRAAMERLSSEQLTRRTASLWREIADRFLLFGEVDPGVEAYRKALDAAGVRSHLRTLDIARRTASKPDTREGASRNRRTT